MTEPRTSTDDLEQRLSHLRHHIAFPPTPDLAASVLAEIDRRRTIPTGGAHRSHRWALAGVVVALVVALLAVPKTRAVVTDWLDLPGVRIVLIDDAPTGTMPPPSAVGMTLLLGERVTLAGAAAEAPFAIRLPAGDSLGAPDEVYVRHVEGGALISLLYLPRSGLPEIGETGVGALLMQFQTEEDVQLLLKSVMGSGDVLPVRIGTAAGYWVAGGRLTVVAPDPSQPVFNETDARSTGNVLLWAEGGVTYRLETALDRNAAIALATSLPPLVLTPTVSMNWGEGAGSDRAMRAMDRPRCGVGRRSATWGVWYRCCAAYSWDG
ncbi:MAG: hypothetical protein H0W06_09840 [Chloroflexia bacterium]|nr:hypothetical protein [Chloroflexia bacterium]